MYLLVRKVMLGNFPLFQTPINYKKKKQTQIQEWWNENLKCWLELWIMTECQLTRTQFNNEHWIQTEFSDKHELLICILFIHLSINYG